MILKYFILTLLILKITEIFIIINREKIYKYFFYNLPKVLFDKNELKILCQNLFFKNQINLKHNFGCLKNKENTIFIVNYPVTKIEYLVSNLFPKDVCLVSSDQANIFLNLVYDFKKHDYISFPSLKKRNNFKNIEKQILQVLKKRSIYVYIENIDGKAGGNFIENGKKRIGGGKYSVGNLRSGMFHISRNNNISLTPVSVDYVHINDDYTIPKQNFEIIIGKSFKIDYLETDEFINKKMEQVKKFYKESKKKFVLNKFKDV